MTHRPPHLSSPAASARPTRYRHPSPSWRGAPTLCRTVGWSGADLAPSSPLGGQPGEGPPRWPPQIGTPRHREAEPPTQGHTARERSASAAVQPQVDGPLVFSMVQIGD